MMATLVTVVAVLLSGACFVSGHEKIHLIFSNHLDVGFDGINPTPGTDFNVINKYFTEFFPQAIATSQTLAERGGRERLQWMTQSWLVSLFLDCPIGMDLHCPGKAEVEAFKAAVYRRDIYWHALPFNGQLEFFDVSLLEFAVQMTHEIDVKFGLSPKRTMSQRDVPGFTRAALPILYAQGVRAVTVGVNGGSAPPGVPHNQPFIWRDTQSQTDMLAMWHPGGYSGVPVDNQTQCVSAAGFDHKLCMAWRQDNAGPHSAEEVLDIFQQTQAAFPGAEVFASTLDNFTLALQAALPNLQLPVVTEEIGDTWAYGIASDANKVAEYRALLRMRTATAWKVQEADYRNFSRLLLKIPEHTWGFDTKTFLHDNANWANKDFHAQLDAHAQNYEDNIAQWQRQRGYMTWALEALDLSLPHASEPLDQTQNPCHDSSHDSSHASGNAADSADDTLHNGKGRKLTARRTAESAHSSAAGLNLPELSLRQELEQLRSELQRQHELTDVEGYEEHPIGEPLKLKSSFWDLEVNTTTGTLSGLQYLWPEQEGSNWATPQHPLGEVLYDTYTEEDYHIIWETYSYSDFSWDFGKLNSSAAKPRHSRLSPTITKVYKQQDGSGFKALLKGSMPAWAVQEAGAPAEVWLDIQAPEDTDSLLLDVIWVNKTATRLPEAMWVQFAPSAIVADPHSWQMYKLGRPISPLEVVFNGSQSMHAVCDDGISVRGSGQGAWEQLNIRSLDAALVSPGEPIPFPVTRTKPDLSKGMAYNLANNIWGTNYIMWQPYEPEQSRMRFRFLLQMTKADQSDQHVQRSASE
ncbi:hypothetical protein WJX82_001496 [Trebouxia sp. C0006]